MTIDTPVSNWQVRMQKEHWFRATRAIDEVLSREEIRRYAVDRVKGITGFSPNYWREKAERYEQAFGLRLTKEVKNSAINLIRIFAEVDSVLIGLADDIVGLGMFQRHITPPWGQAIGLAKGFRQPRQALYDAGIRLNHEAGSALEHTKQRLEALPGVADATQFALSPFFVSERLLPQRPEIMAPRRHSEFYMTYMASPEWSMCRELVLRRAQYVCEWCQERQASDVHHLTYQNLGAEKEHLDDLVALCDDCHNQADQHRWDAHFWKRAEGYARKKYGELWETHLSRQALAEEFESWLMARHPPQTGLCGVGCTGHR